MKFSILTENLSKGLQVVSKAIPSKSALPILSNVLIVAKNGSIQLSATNLETAISITLPASIEEEGSITIPAKLIKEFVSNISSNTISAELKDGALILKSEKTKSKLNGVDAEDYPQLPEVPEKASYININPKNLEAAASIVAFAAGTDSSRPVFTGVYLKHEDNKLTIAATDGFRLSEKTIKVEGKAPSFSTIIPAKTFLEVARIFSGSEEDLKLVLNESENLMLFQTENILVATRILEGQYPDYKRIIPTESSVNAAFSSSELLEAVRLTSLFSKDGNSSVKVMINPDGNIKIVSLSQESGEHESLLPAEVEGDLLEIAFNSKYLLDLLNNVKTEQITIRANTNVSPCLILSDKIEDFVHIIMPIQL